MPIRILLTEELKQAFEKTRRHREIPDSDILSPEFLERAVPVIDFLKVQENYVTIEEIVGGTSLELKDAERVVKYFKDRGIVFEDDYTCYAMRLPQGRYALREVHTKAQWEKYKKTPRGRMRIRTQ